MTYAELEKAYIDLTYTMEKQALRVMAIAANGRPMEAAEAAITLSDTAADARNQYQMQQEQAGSYDLAALRVDTSVASHSETPFEDE